jgi:hypothetical protein
LVSEPGGSKDPPGFLFVHARRDVISEWRVGASLSCLLPRSVAARVQETSHLNRSGQRDDSYRTHRNPEMTMTIQKAAVKRGQMEVTIDDDDFVVTRKRRSQRV